MVVRLWIYRSLGIESLRYKLASTLPSLVSHKVLTYGRLRSEVNFQALSIVLSDFVFLSSLQALIMFFR